MHFSGAGPLEITGLAPNFGSRRLIQAPLRETYQEGTP